MLVEHSYNIAHLTLDLLDIGLYTTAHAPNFSQLNWFMSCDIEPDNINKESKHQSDQLLEVGAFIPSETYMLFNNYMWQGVCKLKLKYHRNNRFTFHICIMSLNVYVGRRYIII